MGAASSTPAYCMESTAQRTALLTCSRSLARSKGVVENSPHQQPAALEGLRELDVEEQRSLDAGHEAQEGQQEQAAKQQVPQHVVQGPAQQWRPGFLCVDFIKDFDGDLGGLHGCWGGAQLYACAWRAQLSVASLTRLHRMRWWPTYGGATADGQHHIGASLTDERLTCS